MAAATATKSAAVLGVTRIIPPREKKSTSDWSLALKLNGGVCVSSSHNSPFMYAMQPSVDKNECFTAVSVAVAVVFTSDADTGLTAQSSDRCNASCCAVSNGDCLTRSTSVAPTCIGIGRGARSIIATNCALMSRRTLLYSSPSSMFSESMNAVTFCNSLLMWS